ncbi:MAG TPA: hypothetical protein VKS60_08760, partial [Stellaceae bacterium]|nr:hypothetical protein [Stellaceae bacterium]
LLSNEEIDLLRRIREKKGRIIYAPLAKVAHLVEAKRLTRTWFRKRAAWQAVSDFTMDPQRFAAKVKEHWHRATLYFNKLPPHLRTINGLVHDTDDPEMFRLQIGACYTMTSAMLAGLEDITLD